MMHSRGRSVKGMNVLEPPQKGAYCTRPIIFHRTMLISFSYFESADRRSAVILVFLEPRERWGRDNPHDTLKPQPDYAADRHVDLYIQYTHGKKTHP